MNRDMKLPEAVDQSRNIETQEHAKKVLARYAGNERVSDLYDDDEQFANAIRDLTGPDFEYPDFSHLTVAQAIKKAEGIGMKPPGVTPGLGMTPGFGVLADDVYILSFHPNQEEAETAMGKSTDARDLSVVPVEVDASRSRGRKTGEVLARRQLPETRAAMAQAILDLYELPADFDLRNGEYGEWTEGDPNDLRCSIFGHHWVDGDLREAKLRFHVKFDTSGKVVDAYAHSQNGKKVGKRCDLDTVESDATKVEDPRKARAKAWANEVKSIIAECKVDPLLMHLCRLDLMRIRTMLEKASDADKEAKRIAGLVLEGDHETVLDGVVHNECSALATGINNDGAEAQVKYLLANGWTETMILKEAGIEQAPNTSSPSE